MLKKLATKIIKKKFGTPARLIAGGVLAGVAIYERSEFEKNNPEYAFYELESHGRLAETRRLVFLSDLHEKEFGVGNAGLIKMIDDVHPDAVLMGGDMIIGMRDTEKNSHRTKVTMKLCRDLAGKYPIYYANGNHELRLHRETFAKKLEDLGVVYLDNRTEYLPGGMTITGINLEEAQYAPVMPKAPTETELAKKMGKLPEDNFNILMAHSPLFLDSYAKTGADLVLSGHFHGGTIRIGEDVGLMTPQYQFFSKKVVGLSQKDGCKMIISPGLGTHSVNIRINDRPQVIVVDIKK